MKSRSGFTIVELLIVIVVIAILAAVSIVAYNGIQNRANDVAIQNDLRSIGKIMEIYKIDNDTYPPLRTGLTPSLGIELSKSSYGRDVQSRNASYCVNATTGKYIFYALSKSGNFFQITSDAGVQATSSVYGYGICDRVGLANTQPDQGLQPSPGDWQAWTN